MRLSRNLRVKFKTWWKQVSQSSFNLYKRLLPQSWQQNYVCTVYSVQRRVCNVKCMIMQLILNKCFINLESKTDNYGLLPTVLSMTAYLNYIYGHLHNLISLFYDTHINILNFGDFQRMTQRRRQNPLGGATLSVQ